MNLNNKVVLVTGASSGIGAATAKLFVKEGAKVVIVGRKENKLKDISAECEKIGGKPLVIVADVSKDSDAKRIIDTTIKHFGQLDVLVNNAGIGASANIESENALQVFDEVMTTNLRAVVYLTHLASPHLKESKGNIINISSVASYAAGAGSFAYATSKAALDHFSRCIALDLASNGVRCNIVNPGPVLTDILDNMGWDEERQAATWDTFKNISPLGRISDSSEIAELIVFLASEKAKGITGSSFVTDNGVLLKLK